MTAAMQPADRGEQASIGPLTPTSRFLEDWRGWSLLCAVDTQPKPGTQTIQAFFSGAAYQQLDARDSVEIGSQEPFLN